MSLREYWVKKIREKIVEKRSRIILALDKIPYAEDCKEPYDNCIRLLKNIEPFIVGVKIGVPLVINYGFSLVENIIREFNRKLVFIYDGKIADVSHVNKLIAEKVYSCGFDLIIAHGVIGLKGGLEGAINVARSRRKGLLILAAMSHEGATRLNSLAIDILTRFCNVEEVVGYILPATYPSLIKIAREILGENYLILSPGVGVQGAPFGMAVKAGADLEIVGRAIYESVSPREEIIKLSEIYSRL